MQLKDTKQKSILKEKEKVIGNESESTFRLVTYISNSDISKGLRVVSTVWNYTSKMGHTEIGVSMDKILPRYVRINDIETKVIMHHNDENEAITYHINVSKHKNFPGNAT